MNQIKKMQQRGLMDPEKEDPFSMFVASTNIRYCYYADTHKVLGNTFGMCVLQVSLFAYSSHQTDVARSILLRRLSVS
jgi:tRNA(Met) C34 N-acetyltransferase TmcA